MDKTTPSQSAQTQSNAAFEAAEAAPAPEKKAHKFKFTVPSAFTILFILTVLAALCTWVAPAGKYAKLSYQKSSQTLVIEHPQGNKDSIPATQ